MATKMMLALVYEIVVVEHELATSSKIKTVNTPRR